MTQPSRKTTTLLLVALALAAVSVSLYFISAGPSRATAPDEALKAADELSRQAGGGEQPRNAEGVPLDAVIDPNHKPGRVELKPSH